MSENKYYHAYERRYRRVYEQGVPFWSGFPREMAAAGGEIDAFLEYYGLKAGAAILECGCGEGYLGSHLAGLGYRYMGIDCSPAAIEKAAGRVASEASVTFEVGDITRMPMFADNMFDAAVDVYCWQMLVTDPDRRAYLSQLRRVLRSGGKAFFLEITQPERFEAAVETYADYVQKFTPDYETDEPREAYANGETRLIQLPRVPSRFNSPEGYAEELEAAGFQVDRVGEAEAGCVLYCHLG